MTRKRTCRWTALPAQYRASAEQVGIPVSGASVLRAADLRAYLDAELSEFDHQVRLFEECAAHELDIRNYPGLHLINASANGGFRKRSVAGQLKAMGVKAGFPDIQLPVARGGYLSLFIELKKMDGAARDDQRWWQRELQAQGHRALIIRGWRSAWAAIQSYYALPASRITSTQINGTTPL